MPTLEAGQPIQLGASLKDGMEYDRIEKPLLQLRKSLKKLPKNPPPEEVHKLRTRARRIEALAAAMEPENGKKTRRLLKSIKPVRKAAGGVRDMDVLTTEALDLPHASEGDALNRLVEHLGSVRQQSASALLDTVERQRKAARRRLKEYAKLVRSVFGGKKPPSAAMAHTAASEDGDGSAALALMAELTDWPPLTGRNIHSFRLKVKELRYILQLYENADSVFLAALKQVKDEIGDWHDWQQLAQVAGEVIDAQGDRALFLRIEKTGEQRLRQALAVSNALRKKYLQAEPRRRKAS